MRRLLAALLFALPLALPGGQFSIPALKPILCSGPANNCGIPVANGDTLVIVARLGAGSITVTAGNPVSYHETLTPDYVSPFTGNAIYHLAFTTLPYNTDANVTFPPNTGSTVTLLRYEGLWQFSKGAEGDYSNANSVFPDCTNGGDCPYYWTKPVVPEKGDLLIAFADANSTDCGSFRPGPGWAIETVNCIFSVEDKIASVEAPDIGSMYASMLDGSDSGGSHWIMGLAVYTRVK